MDFAQLIREGKLQLAPGATLKHNGKRKRPDGRSFTKPPAAKAKAKRRARRRGR